jgi:adenylate cyclase
MRLRPRLPVLLAGLIPTLVTAGLSLYRPAPVANLEARVRDTVVRSAGTRPPAGRIVIVDVDERSLSAIGQWPWRRDLVGRLVGRLRNLGASIIALDIVFAESDRYEGTGAAPDAALAEAFRAGRVVLGYAMKFDGAADGSSECVQHPLGLAIVRRGDDDGDPFFRATGAVCSLPELTTAAGTSGFLNAAPDPDGILRRVPLLIGFNDRVYPALALAAVTAVSGTREVALHVANVNTSRLMLDGRSVPLDGKSNLIVRYRGRKRTFPYVSAAAVLAGQAPASLFRHKLVFVGTTALGTREVVATPFDTLFTGVEVQATVADNLLQRDFIRRPEHGTAVETQAVLGLGLAIALLVARFGVAWGALGVAIGLVAVWGAAVWLMSAESILLSPLYPTVGLASALASMTAAQSAIERRRADREGRGKITSQHLMVQSLLSLTAVRDAETGRHSRRTQQYTRVLAERLSSHPEFSAYLTRDRVDLLSALAPLHDIGKVGVPDRLLNKPGPLTPEELVEMRRHPAHGRDVIVNAERAVGVKDDVILAMAKEIVYTHHERWDGTGYPEGLRGTEIPIPGRVMAVVDVYDAVLTRRLYAPQMSHAEAVACIVGGRGTHFDPAVVDAFVAVLPELRKLATAD